MDAAGDAGPVAERKRGVHAPTRAYSGALAGHTEPPVASAPGKPDAARVPLPLSSAGAPKTAREGACAPRTLAAVERALRSLVNRSLVVPTEELKSCTLVPMAADFLRKKKPEVVAETGDRLEKRAYALSIENSYEKHDRFKDLAAAGPGIAPALALFLAGDNARLQTVGAALTTFLHFQGRWDEWLALCEQAEARAVVAADHANVGWRAYQARFRPFTVSDASRRGPRRASAASARPDGRPFRRSAPRLPLPASGHALPEGRVLLREGVLLCKSAVAVSRGKANEPPGNVHERQRSVHEGWRAFPFSRSDADEAAKRDETWLGTGNVAWTLVQTVRATLD